MPLLLLPGIVFGGLIHPAGFSPDIRQPQRPETPRRIGGPGGISRGELLKQPFLIASQGTVVRLLQRESGPRLQAVIFRLFLDRKDLLILPCQFELQVLGGELVRGCLPHLL